MTSTYNPVFSANSYKIQINILYNATTSKDDEVANDDNATNNATNNADNNPDSFNNNYYVLNTMNDILIEEFSTQTNYDNFINKYANKDNPIYIVNDSYYLDTNVINTIKRNSSAKFPNYNSTIPVKKFEFKNHHEKFVANKDLKKKHEITLFNIFKNTFLNTINELRTARADIPQITNDLSSATTYDELFRRGSFINNDAIGSELFHKYIQNIYDNDNTTNSKEKEALQVFYNISYTNLGYKFKYEYFLNPETINNIFRIIQENSTNDPYDRRRTPLNSNSTKEDIYNRYYKYVFPNKKDTNNLSDADKDIILMFYNVYYIIKNIYLLDNTIINVSNFRTKNSNNNNNNNNNNIENKKYYISQVSLLDLKDNITHFKIEKNKVIIFIKATLKYIIENPILQINYLIDDLENIRQSFSPQSNILLPKDINSNYSSYDKIYIHDKVNYSNNTHEIDNIVANARKKKFIKNKEELFFNTKALKLFNYFFRKKIYNTSATVSASASAPSDHKIIMSNIKFLLYNIFKFYNSKEFKKYYIADTYIQYFNNNAPLGEYFSITNGKISKTTEKYEVITALFTQLSQQQLPSSTSPSSIPKIIYQEIPPSDARLTQNIIYKINVVFRCYFDKTGKKPTFVRTLIAEKCLARAQKLDSDFADSLYKTFNLPENYLYNKLANITRKQKAITGPENKMPENKMPENKMPENKIPENKMPENKINPLAKDAIITNKRGGKITKKYNQNRNITLKHKNNKTVKFINNNIYQ